MRSLLIQRLDEIGALASGSKIQRVINCPINYFLAIAHREFIHPLSHKPLYRAAKLFWGDRLKVALPSGLDMYILGAKAHDSEIRLSKYLINNLNCGDLFIDVGAHFGYYSKLAAHLVGDKGSVISIEPARFSFEILKQNTKQKANIEIHNVLIASQSRELTFYEFPIKFAEYNSINIEQYKSADWFDENVVTKYQRDTMSIDDLIKVAKIDFIKIDVEGAEYEVLLGAKELIKLNYPIISMEYVHENRCNLAHKAAVDYLLDLGYQPHVILQSGDIEGAFDLDQSLVRRRLESDNFIFIKPQP